MRSSHLCMHQVADSKVEGVVKEANAADGPALCESCGGKHGDSIGLCPVVRAAQYGEEGPVETAQQAEQDEWQVVPSAVKPNRKDPQGSKKAQKGKKGPKPAKGNADVVITVPRNGRTNR